MAEGNRQPSANRSGEVPGRWLQRVIYALLAGLLVVLLTTAYFFAQSVGLEAAKSLTESDAIARGVAASIQVREEGFLSVLQAYATRFKFREAVKRRDRAEALVHLRQLVGAFPELDRPFLADPAGVLWAVYPEAPQSLGRSFADRDWYRGVSREWRPYVSEVYSQFRDGALAVALAVPIRDLNGKVIGIIVSPQRLEVIRQWLLPIQVPDGDLYIVDRKGQLLFHRARTGPEHLADYANLPVVQRLLRGEEGVAELDNPADGEVRLTAYHRLPSLGWGVVVHRSKNLVLQRMRRLILASGAAGLLLTVILAGLGAVAIRNQWQMVVERTRAEEAKAQLAAIVETANDGIVSADSRGNIIYFNKGAERIFAYSARDMIGRSLTLLMPERFHEAHRKGFRRFLSTGEAHVVGKTVELAGRRNDGTEFPLELSLAIPISSSNRSSFVRCRSTR